MTTSMGNGAGKGRAGFRLSDRASAFFGSWVFIGGFAVLLAAWTAWNAWARQDLAFDPFPYIGLTTLLTVIGMFQGPLIMMSQNRQAQTEAADTSAILALLLQARSDNAVLMAKIGVLEAKVDAMATIDVADEALLDGGLSTRCLVRPLPMMAEAA